MTTYWHGGVPGLKAGDLIEPGHERAVRDDCPICQARQRGEAVMVDGCGIDVPTGRPDRVYATTNRLYAKHYASLYGRGWLYRVEPVGDFEVSEEDTIETVTAPALRVVSIYDRAVLLTMSERRRLMREWTAADLARIARAGRR